MDDKPLFPSRKYQHIFFDLDHTLWDFDTNSTHALSVLYQDKLKNHGFSFEDFMSHYRKINEACWSQYRTGNMTKGILRVKRFFDTFLALGFEDEYLAKYFADTYLEISPYQTALMPGAHTLLSGLKSRDYILHLITNGFEEVQSIKIRECKLDTYFEEIIISEQVGYNKPHPKVFLHALERSNATPAHSLMVGDNYEADVLGAQHVGIDCVWFNPGYAKSVENNEAKYEVRSLLEINDLLP